MFTGVHEAQGFCLWKKKNPTPLYLIYVVRYIIFSVTNVSGMNRKLMLFFLMYLMATFSYNISVGVRKGIFKCISTHVTNQHFFTMIKCNNIKASYILWY